MDLETIIVVSLVLGAGGLVKGILGLGMPLVALPGLTAVFGLQQAIGIIVVPIIISNIWQIWSYRAALFDPVMRFLPVFLAGGIVGIGIGTVALVSFPERLLEAALGVMLLAYVALRLARPDFVIKTPMARRLALPVGVAGGIVQGATGIVAPIGVTFINAMRFYRSGTVFAVSVMFLVFGAAQLSALTVAGVYRLDWLWLGLVATLPVLAAMPLGEVVGRRLGAATFDRVILVLLSLIGLKMVLGL